MSRDRRRNAAEVIVLPDLEALSRAAAERLVRLAQDRKPFRVTLAGGSTPQRLYQLLATPALREQVPWEAVHVFWGDERAVPPDHPESNYRMARETLLEHVPIPAQNVHRIRGELEPDAAASAYTQELRRFFGARWPAFDLVLLGMGNDGHTVSLFPGSDAIQERELPVIGVAGEYQDRPARRVTLTPPAINAARLAMFLVSGGTKAGALKAVLTGPYQPEVWPAQIVQPDAGHVLWLVDEAAAVELHGDLSKDIVCGRITSIHP